MGLQTSAINMRDKGIDKGLIREFETSAKKFKGMFGFRKLFWDYLKKLNVPFWDTCCEDAGNEGIYPVRYNSNLQRLEYFNGTEWADITGISETTTTTTAAPTTTTTTVAPTTTTTTAEATTTTTTV